MLAVLSGGTGTPKLLQGLIQLLDRRELSIIVNTGEDLEVSGLYVAPDLDTVIYTLAGIVNEHTWYGIEGDTFHCHEMLARLGQPELLRIGDRDRATHLRRTLLLRSGKSLSEATRILCDQFGVRAKVMPMSDDRVTTRVRTERGEMSFNEFWVARRARDEVLGVRFEGAEGARPAPGVLEGLEEADAIIIGPSNPVTSIGPILAVPGIRSALSRLRGKVVAVSPIIGRAPFSGPAGVLMRGLGYEVSPIGVAEIYRDVASRLVVDPSDRGFEPGIRGCGVEPAFADLRMGDLASRIRLAREVLSIAGLR